MKALQRVGSWFRKAANYLAPLSPGWWWPVVRESYTGAWQSNVTVDQTAVTANWAVFSCATLIANDIAKMPARVLQFDATQKIWLPTAHRPVLRKPNRYQTWPDFIRSWVFSLLFHGNTYVLKERTAEGFVGAMYVLDPCRVRPLVAEDGSVYYQLSADNLSSIEESRVVPATEIMHDRINTIFHPLVGVSPIFACGVAAMQALAIQENSAKFFQNMSRPSGMLTAPGAISNDTASRVKELFESNFSGENIGRLFVAGDGLEYEAMTISAEDAQLIEQLKFTGEMSCATFHVPPYKLGLGAMPTVNNTASLNQQYYDQCLHPICDSIEYRLDEGLELRFPHETRFDTSELLRMDPATRYDAHSKAIGGGWLAPNEARRSEDMPPVDGGDTPYMQEQNWPLAQLAKRPPPADPAATPALPAPADEEDPSDDEARALTRELLAA